MTLVDGNRFSVVLTCTFGVTVMAVSGEVDGATSDRLRREIDELLDAAEEPPTLVLDLSNVSFLDSTGLNALVHALRRMRAMGGELTLSAPTEATRKLLAITGLDRAFTVTRV